MSGRDAPPLNAGIRRLWTTAAEQDVPWTMVLAHDLPHAFDALVESAESRRLNDAAIAQGGSAGVAHDNSAKALALAGRVDGALDRLEKAMAAGFATRERMEADADLASLRADPRYGKLLDRRQ